MVYTSHKSKRIQTLNVKRFRQYLSYKPGGHYDIEFIENGYPLFLIARQLGLTKARRSFVKSRKEFIKILKVLIKELKNGYIAK